MFSSGLSQLLQVCRHLADELFQVLVAGARPPAVCADTAAPRHPFLPDHLIPSQSARRHVTPAAGRRDG